MVLDAEVQPMVHPRDLQVLYGCELGKYDEVRSAAHLPPIPLYQQDRPIDRPNGYEQAAKGCMRWSLELCTISLGLVARIGYIIHHYIFDENKK